MKTKLMAAVAAVVIVLSSAAPTLAADSVPEPEDMKAELAISFAIEDTAEGTKTAISGATFEITRVADLNWHGGSPDYVLTDEFKSTNIDFNGMTASQSEDAAKKLSSMSTVSFASATTDEEGSANFYGLEHGIYLVEETKVSGDALNYSSVDPYLVLVPGYKDGEWQYRVTSSPKTEPIEKPKPEKPDVTPEGPDNPNNPDNTSFSGKPSAPVKTGDPLALEAIIWVGVAVCSLSAIIILLVGKRREQKKEDK